MSEASGGVSSGGGGDTGSGGDGGVPAPSCAHCNLVLPPTSKFCLSCGRPALRAPETRGVPPHCVACGVRLFSREAKFCHECNAPQLTPSQVDSTPFSPTSAQAQNPAGLPPSCPPQHTVGEAAPDPRLRPPADFTQHSAGIQQPVGDQRDKIGQSQGEGDRPGTSGGHAGGQPGVGKGESGQPSRRGEGLSEMSGGGVGGGDRGDTGTSAKGRPGSGDGGGQSGSTSTGKDGARGGKPQGNNTEPSPTQQFFQQESPPSDKQTPPPRPVGGDQRSRPPPPGALRRTPPPPPGGDQRTPPYPPRPSGQPTSATRYPRPLGRVPSPQGTIGGPPVRPTMPQAFGMPPTHQPHDQRSASGIPNAGQGTRSPPRSEMVTGRPTSGMPQAHGPDPSSGRPPNTQNANLERGAASGSGTHPPTQAQPSAATSQGDKDSNVKPSQTQKPPDRSPSGEDPTLGRRALRPEPERQSSSGRTGDDHSTTSGEFSVSLQKTYASDAGTGQSKKKDSGQPTDLPSRKRGRDESGQGAVNAESDHSKQVKTDSGYSADSQGRTSPQIPHPLQDPASQPPPPSKEAKGTNMQKDGPPKHPDSLQGTPKNPSAESPRDSYADRTAKGKVSGFSML